MRSKTVDSLLLFNFGTVKHLAKPGSWRRGYGYFLGGQVQELALTETGVHGSVKGNFKDAYQVDLTFTPEAVQAACDCPLEEEWCKHAVAVALVSIDQHLWEQFWKQPVPDESIPPDLSDFPGNYRFVVDLKRKPRFLSLQLIERRNDKPLNDIEPVLRAAMAMQQSGQAQFSEAEKREFSLLQLCLKHSKGKTADGWYMLPASEAETALKILTSLGTAADPEGNRLIVESTPLKPLMAVNVSMAGNVLISIHWIQSEPHNAFPLEEITLISRELPWGFRKNHLYPLENTLNNLPHHLTRNTFTDIRDADGGKFMYEELPGLRKKIEIDEADILEQLRLEQRPPEKILTLELVDEASLRIRAMLDFSYDGIEVAYSRTRPESPYVMVIKKATETIYWVKRDYKQEQQYYNLLVDGKLQPMQTNFLNAEGDDAIDFVNLTLPQLGEDWLIKGAEALSSLKTAEFPLKIRAAIDFSTSVDEFEMSISGAVGPQRMELDEVQQHLMQGKKYFYLPQAGYVEVPLATILQFGKTLQSFEADEIDRDTYRIKTYRAGLIAELVDQGVELDLSPKFQTFWETISTFGTLEDIPVPEKVQAELRPYQKQGFHWLWFLYSYGLNGILADDMGLGKTLQTLVLLQQAKDVNGSKPSLIVCPTSVVFNWQNEARRFTPDLKVINLTGPNRYGLYKKIPEADLVITSYALLRRDITALKGYGFRYVILDESQNIKNYESQTAQASKELQTNHRLALSGTPIENRLSELWSVFDFLMPGFLDDLDGFKYKYIQPIEEKGSRDAERRLKKQIFPFILRRLKRDVAKDLPPKVENVTYCELTEKQQELYLEILEKTREQVFAQVAEKGIGGSQMSIFAALLRLRQICCHPYLLGEELNQGVAESGKFEALQEMLEEVISEGHRVLLFSQFVEMLKIVKAWLEKKGIKHEYLTGETKDRETIVTRFNRDDSIPIFLISLKAGGTGLNLTGADYVIHYDPWWNPAAEDQATDRAHRIGQTKSVFVYRLIAKGTVEEKIMKLKERKRDLVDSIISADRDMGKLLSFEDLKEILMPDF